MIYKIFIPFIALIFCGLTLFGCQEKTSSNDTEQDLLLPFTERQDVPLSDVGIYMDDEINEMAREAEQAADEVSDLVPQSLDKKVH